MPTLAFTIPFLLSPQLDNFELQINRLNTQRFIDADPLYLTLLVRSTVWSGGSKRMVDGVARPAQKFKMIYPGGDQIVTTSDGTTKKLDFILVGLWDCEISVGDHWTEGSQDYEITSIEPFNGYETKAHGVSIGGHPQHG